ncbi:MAG: aldo/keto reductase [Clostridia bacterium]
MYKANQNRYSGMLYENCGKAGLKLPQISLGLWHNYGENDNFENMKNMIFTAFDKGITHFDLANNYGLPAGSAESNFGKILNSEMKSYRDEMVVSTKAGYTMWEGPYGDFGSRKYLLSSLDQSLKRLNLEYVDIFYHHRMDKNTPLDESLGALATAVSSGKALYAGISNYDSETTEKAVKILKDLHCPFVINQVRYSFFEYIEKCGNNLLNVASANGIGLIAFSPLAQGRLTERYLNGIPEDSRIVTDGRFLKKENITKELLVALNGLNQIAQQRGQSLAQMSLAWVLRDKAITSVLIGASKPAQILDNMQAIQNIYFSNEELDNIDELTKNLVVWKK